MFPTALSDHRKGLLLTAIGGLALSVDIPLMRLADGELWSILAARSIATLGVTLLVATVLRIANGRWPVLVPGWPGLVTGLLYGLTTVVFLLAVFNTSTANVVFIVAFNPMFAAMAISVAACGFSFRKIQESRAANIGLKATMKTTLAVEVLKTARRKITVVRP